MRQTTITRGGQISIPAEVRRRWRTSRIALDDRGDSIVLRPIPEDPIEAAIGSLSGPGLSSEELRARSRSDEGAAEARKYRWLTRRSRERP